MTWDVEPWGTKHDYHSPKERMRWTGKANSSYHAEHPLQATSTRTETLVSGGARVSPTPFHILKGLKPEEFSHANSSAQRTVGHGCEDGKMRGDDKSQEALIGGLDLCPVVGSIFFVFMSLSR